MGLTIKTNNHWRQFKYRDEVPPKILADQFDWTNDDYAEHGGYLDGFFCYKGYWYHLDDFMRGGIESWHGYAGDSYFSGVVIRISDDGEEYQIGTYYS